MSGPRALAVALGLTAVALAAPAGAKPLKRAAGPTCATAAQEVLDIRGEPDVLMSERLDLADAQALLDAINHIGVPTSYAARTLVVRVYQDEVMVGLFDACRTFYLPMTLRGFNDAMKAVRDAAT